MPLPRFLSPSACSSLESLHRIHAIRPTRYCALHHVVQQWHHSLLGGVVYSPLAFSAGCPTVPSQLVARRSHSQVTKRGAHAPALSRSRLALPRQG